MVPPPVKSWLTVCALFCVLSARSSVPLTSRVSTLTVPFILAFPEVPTTRVSVPARLLSVAVECTRSVSVPAPRSTPPFKMPPDFTSITSVPAPRLTAPRRVAPDFTSTVVFPPVSTTASSFALPTTAPLLRLIVTASPEPAATLIAESSSSSSPVTVEDTLTVTAPLPPCLTNMPCAPLLVTGPPALISTVPPCC